MLKEKNGQKHKRTAKQCPSKEISAFRTQHSTSKKMYTPGVSTIVVLNDVPLYGT